MACRYYDDILVAKIKQWVPEASKLRVLKPEESKRLFELTADDNKDQAFKLPLIAISRNTDVELLSNVKSSKSFDGLKIYQTEDKTMQLNVLPIKLMYQLDIYTRTADEGDECVRSFLFKLVNNPLLIIDIPYNGANIRHVANIQVLSTVSDTSAISERIFSGQFTRWTIQLEIKDAFLFNIPYRNNWKFVIKDTDNNNSGIELSTILMESGEIENI